MMVARKQVGVVLGLDSSRLARNTADWFQLLRWLRLTDTLFAKEGKVYDLKEGDSRIVLGIEGTLSEEGRFQIRARLDAGLESKAERGELYRRVASGYVLDGGQLCKDPDERVRHAIGEVFASFRETGSARQAVQRLRAAGTQLPGGREPGRTEWKEATYSRVHQILTNPLMGGAYVYGRRRTEVSLGERGEVRKQVVRVPQEEWGVLLEGRHEGYVSWEEWQAVQRRTCVRRRIAGRASGDASRWGERGWRSGWRVGFWRWRGWAGWKRRYGPSGKRGSGRPGGCGATNWIWSAASTRRGRPGGGTGPRTRTIVW